VSYSIEAGDLPGGGVTAPIIESTTLAIDDPTGDRFTSETFSFESTLSQDGDPVSTKKIEAYVEGTLDVSYETDSITSVTTTAASQTSGNTPGGVYNNNVKGIASDRNGKWMQILNSTSVSIGTGDPPTWGTAFSPTATGANVANLYGVAGSTAGTWIIAGYDGTTGIALIMRSTDHGSTWTDVSPLSTYYSGITSFNWITSDNSGNWIAVGAAGDGSGPAWTKSSDDGQTWSDIASYGRTGEIAHGIVTYGGAWIVAVTTTGNGIHYRSTDFASTWVISSYPNPQPTGTVASIGISDSGTIIASYGGSNIWRSAVHSTGGAGYLWGVVSAGVTTSFAIAYAGGTAWINYGYTTKATSTNDGATSAGWSATSVPYNTYIGSAASNATSGGVVVLPAYNATAGNPIYITIEPGTVELDLSGTKSLSDIQIGMSTTNGATATGSVSAIDTNTPSITLSNPTGTWSTGETVVTDAVPIANSTLYCVFNSNGDISSLSSTAPDPPYTTTDNPVDITFTFPATFPTGQTPDQELPAGTTFNATNIAFNAVGVSVGSATVTP